MHNLGHTRSVFRRNHLLHTPDAFIRAPLPGMRNATAVVHTSPAAGARFTQFTAEMESGGILDDTTAQRFLYVLEGSLVVDHDGSGHTLAPGAYAYLPSGAKHRLLADTASRIAVIEKPYQATDQAGPEFFTSRQEDVPANALLGDPSLHVQLLLPDSPEFDFAVNIMTFEPGASLSLVEMHVMEHGLLMLQGGGIYRLDEHWYPVSAGDFIWMGSFCPQWFGALGKTQTKYLIYKDWNRHPLD